MLTASGGTGYVWSNAATTAAITVTTGGSYTVTVTNAAGCTATANSSVTVNALPTAAITPGGSTTFCQGGSVVLTASGGTGYVWSNAATTAAITVSTGGSYTVTVTNAAGCTATASQSVTVNALPTAVITPSGSTTFCEGGSVILTASGGTGYVWSNAATTIAITVSTGGSYTVTVTNTGGCASVDSVQVTVHPSVPVTVWITPQTNPVSSGTPVTFTAIYENGGAAPFFQWIINGTPVDGATGETLTYIPSDNDQVSCSLLSNAPCAANNPAVSNTVILSVITIPMNITVTGAIGYGQSECYHAEQTLVVAGDPETFTVHPGGSVLLMAVQRILLRPGTIVAPGGYLHGFITNGSQFCSSSTIPSSPVSAAIPEKQEELKARIWPNPTTGSFTVALTGHSPSEKVRMELFTLTGESLYSREMIANEDMRGSLSGFPDGYYFLRIVTAEGTITTPILKAAR